MRSFFFNLSWFVFYLTSSVIMFVLTIIGLCVYKNPIVSIGFTGVGLFLIFTYSTFLSVKESFEKLLLDLILMIQNKENKE